MEVLEWRQGCRYWNGGRDVGTGKEAGMEVLERRQEWRELECRY
jgi:hypothetical protein